MSDIPFHSFHISFVLYSLDISSLAPSIVIVISVSWLPLFYCSYETTSSRKNRSLAKELVTGAIASVLLVCNYASSINFCVFELSSLLIN